MKKLNKLVAILVAMAMVLSLSIIAAFADDANPTTGTNVNFSKKLYIAQGLTAPENFTFEITPISVDGDPYVAATTGENATPANMPTKSDVVITMSGMSDTDADGFIIKNAVLSFTAAEFPHAGVYVYELSEKDNGTSGMTYSGKTYVITVAKDKDGNIRVTVQDKADNTGAKLDGDPVEDTDLTDGDDAEQPVKFENTYTKTADDTQAADGVNASFLVSKTVTGKYGDVLKDFHFAVTVTLPASNSTATVSYFKTDGTTTTPVTNLSDITLKSGEQFYATGAPVGTTYTVTENLAADAAAGKYTSTTIVTEGGTEVTAKETVTQADLSTKSDATLAVEGTGATVSNALVVDNGANSAAYTNENTKDAGEDDPGTTGILVSNLPYIALALVAIGGLVAYVIVRRKADDEA